MNKIDGTFLFCANNFCSTLDIGNNNVNIWIQTYDGGFNQNLSTIFNDQIEYTQGVTIIGTYKTEFCTKFPNRTEQTPYRKLIST
jgi:hypothetical protein